ncbi:amino acid--tRNA ligase-related protein [Planctomycetota bacterium]
MSERATTYRTHTCGELRAEHAGLSVKLSGTLHRKVSDKVFLVSDRSGQTLVALGPKSTGELDKQAVDLAPRDLVYVEGSVVKRKTGSADTPTGDIWVSPTKVKLLCRPEPPPVDLDDEGLAFEERLRYRHLDLRRPSMQERLALRTRVLLEVRKLLSQRGFLEVETPYLESLSADAEGSLVVPARPGEVFALPLRERLYSRLLMAGGFDRTFQIARCFRRPDRLRAGEQVEYTVLDLAAAFVALRDLLALADGVLKSLWSMLGQPELPVPVTQLSYDEAITRFGTAQPDLRIDLTLLDVSEVVQAADGGPWKPASEADGGAYAVVLRGGSRERKDERLNGVVTDSEARARATVTWHGVEEEGSLSGPWADEIPNGVASALVAHTGVSAGDLLFVSAASQKRVAARGAGAVRTSVGERLGLLSGNPLSLVWVTGLPYLDYDADQSDWVPVGSAFSLPHPDHADLARSGEARETVRSQAVSLVLNGSVVGSGSIWSNDGDLVRSVAKLLGCDDDAVEDRYGTAVEAFQFGMPPHGGVAIDLDCIMAFGAGLNGPAEVIPFPKSPSGEDPLLSAPCKIAVGQLRDLLEP